ncbi:MAG: hypothetical protein PHD01_10040 [Geobacteraceae bacterium]|nr:hypothetical protein [Geobacteraceae bacterium]
MQGIFYDDGNFEDSWLSTDDILLRFAKTTQSAWSKYFTFVTEGVEQGRRPELAGCGLLRSIGGWRELSVMIAAKSFLRRQGGDLERLAKIVADHLEIEVEEVWSCGKQPKRIDPGTYGVRRCCIRIASMYSIGIVRVDDTLRHNNNAL